MKKALVFIFLLGVIAFTVTRVSPFKDVRPAWIVPGGTQPPTHQSNATKSPETKTETKFKAQEVTVDGSSHQLTLPDNLEINVFAQDLGSPRFMAIDASGTLLVSVPKQGKVVAFPDNNQDGVADRQVNVISNLQQPHGLAFHNGYLYIAEENKISRLILSQDLTANSREVIVDGLPFGGGESTGKGHRTRTIGFDQEGLMYLSVGSSCNFCEEEGRGVVMRFNADGSNPEIFAKGIRNAVGFVFHPVTDELWATENSRDLLGDDFPPDEIIVVKENAHYGWPYCNGDMIPDPNLGKGQNFCDSTEPPLIALQAHSAPLGLRFIDDFLYVAYHGSWNRSIPTGYKIVQINPETHDVNDWLTGWLVQGKAWGRPVDIIQGSSGDIYISDDFAGVIYRITTISKPSL